MTLNRIAIVGSLAIALAACGNTTGERALSGGGIGAGVGAAGAAITGGSVLGGALVGGAVGAAAGALTDCHDINIGEAEAAQLVGAPLIGRLRALTMALYGFGAAHAERCGILLADTKFEFGLTPEGEVLLIDEVMTPDSSRYWPKDQFTPGRPQFSFDKQYVRDYLEQIKWNKQPPVPALPEAVVAKTREKYREAFRLLVGRELD